MWKFPQSFSAYSPAHTDIGLSGH